MTEVPIEIMFEPFNPQKSGRMPGVAIGRWTVRGISSFPVEGTVEERHHVGNVPALGIPTGVEIHQREVTILNRSGGFVSSCLALSADCRDVRSGLTFLRTEEVRDYESGCELTLLELK
jgi:hypothetical protein